ncbi:urease subunit beta [Chamaesiphon minutus]|uniref:Urease subunit beta n=1 Tax=Chamaesiphon minutus (strain ATCC 27169 / PCC 6605) TaxID=1173020 RepID=K9UHB4_CHAP6|nr:urease subunit beta [Chamaesiphon minutus]AFY93604.1 urease, beta subunit [Chamaesiphon minutus PCC 6605]
MTNIPTSNAPTSFPGEVLCESGSLQLNAGRETKTLTVANLGDRPIQVGSHYHFLEVNRALQFDRSQAYGFRLDIPAGTAIRFEPGDTKTVSLVAIGGTRHIQGLNGLVNQALDAPNAKEMAMERVQRLGYSTIVEESHGN